jgi:hypothetical protein
MSTNDVGELDTGALAIPLEAERWLSPILNYDPRAGGLAINVMALDSGPPRWIRRDALPRVSAAPREKKGFTRRREGAEASTPTVYDLGLSTGWPAVADHDN